MCDELHLVVPSCTLNVISLRYTINYIITYDLMSINISLEKNKGENNIVLSELSKLWSALFNIFTYSCKTNKRKKTKNM